ncbi:MAG: triose-phosphate isomerase [Gammaproteobacteria bacterium]|nr:triose-phosphate isomerase [Gammaproteobacteria bacterium]MBQ0840007.1 triose-phosphate isomerase [Gammaproteobacteria bacterium]
MRRPLIVGNWKMNGSRHSSIELADNIARHFSAGDGRVECAVCPPHVFLADVASALGGSSVGLGAQDVSQFEQGAYTGDVSAAMLAEFSCTYVLVGHSERRACFGETSSQVAAKFLAAQGEGLTPILCVGETLAERQADRTLEVIAEQIDAVVEAAGLDALTSAVVAYEPVWAIGTGEVASPAQAQEILAFIRARLGEKANTVRLLYGGSVNAENAAQLFEQHDIDGALVGGAALQAEQFMTICQMAET